MDVLRQQIIEQATCSVCLEIRVPIYACGAGCSDVTCGPCRELPGFDYKICPSCRGKQPRSGAQRNLALERFVATLKLAETTPARAQPAPTQEITPGRAAAVSRPRARATGCAAVASVDERKESHRVGSTGRGGKRPRLERRPAGRKRTRQRPAASAAAAPAPAAATASGPAVADPMKLIKAEQEGFYVGKQAWVFFPDHGQRFVGKVVRRYEDHELGDSEDGSRTCFWQIDFPDGTTWRCSTSDLTQGLMNKLVPPYLVQGYRKNFTVDFDAKTTDTLMSVRLAGPKKAPVKVVRDRFLFTNSVVVSVLGGNGMDTFRHPARGRRVQYLCDQSVHVQPDWNPRMPKHAGCNGAMLLKSKHGLEDMRTIPLFNARGPSDAADQCNTTRKWEYCGNYIVPPTSGDADVVIGQNEFVAMGPHLHCPHCYKSHSLFQHLSARDTDTNRGRFNKIPNQVLEFQCPNASDAKPGKGVVHVILVDHGFPIDSSLKVTGTEKLRPSYCVFKEGQIEGGRTAQQKIVDRGALAVDYGLSSYLINQSAKVQKMFSYGLNSEQMDDAMKQKRRQKYFEILDSGESTMQWVQFRFKEYDEYLYELLCAAEAEHQLDPKAATNPNVRSAVARGNVQMVQIYRELRRTLIGDGCSAYNEHGRYHPPQLEVAAGGRRKASECGGL
eukprot:COSAG02_NODE_7067_length_3200_cov_6.962593_2_plen_671_part_00